MSLGNVIPAAYKESVIPFLSEKDKELLEKYRVASFEVSITYLSKIYFISSQIKLNLAK